ncbi:MAG: hypothetical protein ACLTW9_22865 [Enterocloster sp.]
MSIESGIPAVRLSQSNMKIFYNLCKEHELEGVVASHILEDGLCELPEYWKEDYLKEKERIEYFKTKTEQICTEMKKNGIPMIILKKWRNYDGYYIRYCSMSYGGYRQLYSKR